MKKDDIGFLFAVVILVFFCGAFFSLNLGTENLDDFTGLVSSGSRLDKDPKTKTPAQCYDDCLTACGAAGGGNPVTCSDKCTKRCNKDTGKEPSKAAVRKVVMR